MIESRKADGKSGQANWPLRLIWFVLLWLGGLGAVSALAYVLRLWIAPR